MTDNGHVVVEDLSSHNDVQAVQVPLLQTFKRGQPKTLGAVQIMIGGVMFIFGVELTIHMHSMSAGSGFLFWGGLMFVIAGTLSIVTHRNLTLNLVKASLGINLVSSITAMIGIILHSLDLSTFAYLYKIQLHSKCVQSWTLYLSRTVSISAAMLILSVLELIIAIYLCVFAFKATHSHHFPPKVEYVPDPPEQNASTTEDSDQGQGPLTTADNNPQEQN